MLKAQNGRADKKAFPTKFKEFRLAFAVLSLVLVAGALAGAVTWSVLALTPFGTGLGEVLSQRLSKAQSGPFFMLALDCFRPAAFFLVCSFIFGVTLYSPVVSFALCFLFGVSGGMTLGLCSQLDFSGVFGVLFAVEAAYFLLCASVVASSCAFGFCVFLKQSRRIPDKEERLFGGSLFCGSFYGNFNPRFLFSYVFVFLFYAVLLFCFACLRTAAAVLI